MGKIIISQHALEAGLDRVAEKASFQQWTQQVHETPNVDRRRMLAVLEAASSDQIGLHLLARRVVHKETYQQAVKNLSAVTKQKITTGDARQRVCRVMQNIKTSVLE